MGKKTKNVIIDAYLSLVEKNSDCEKISITDIVAECNISRQTFYYHFNDIEDMITWAFETDTQNILARLPNTNQWYDAANVYNEFFKKYGVFLNKMLYTKDFVFIYSLLYKSIYDFSREFVTRKYNKPINKNSDFLITACAYALIGFIIKELKKKDPDFNSMLLDIASYLNQTTKK